MRSPSGHPKGPKTIFYGLLGGPGGSGLALGALIGSGWLRLAPAAGLRSCAQFWLRLLAPATGLRSCVVAALAVGIGDGREALQLVPFGIRAPVM